MAATPRILGVKQVFIMAGVFDTWTAYREPQKNLCTSAVSGA